MMKIKYSISFIVIFIIILIISLANTFSRDIKVTQKLNQPSIIENITYINYGQKEGGPQKLDICIPNNDLERNPGIMYIHGGGWTGGDKAQYEQACLWLAEQGYVVANINYRLSPEFPYPANVDDSIAAFKFFIENADDFGLDPQRVAVIGGSSGGHLSSMVGLLLTDSSVEYDIEAEPKAVVDFNGITDVLGWKYQKGAGYLVGENLELLNKEASPIYKIHKDAPPFLIVHGTNDTIVPFNDSLNFADALRKQGIFVELILLEGEPHAFLGWPWDINKEEDKKMNDAVLKFLDWILKKN